MSSARLVGSRKSRVKGHREYTYNYQVGEKFNCFKENINFHSRNAIIVKSLGVMGHVPEGLVKILYPLLENGRIERISGKVIGCARPAPEGTWATGGGIELPCKYKLYGKRKDKDVVKRILKCVI